MREHCLPCSGEKKKFQHAKRGLKINGKRVEPVGKKHESGGWSDSVRENHSERKLHEDPEEGKAARSKHPL